MFNKGYKEGYILISAIAVSNNFIRRGLAEKVEITPLKLQKLVYFLYKDYLQKTGIEIFSDNFETWKYGPVLTSIYAEFNSYGNRPITTYGQDSKGDVYVVEEKGTFKEVFDRVWSMYKDYSGMELSNLTHMPNTAWSKANANQRQYLDKEDIKNEETLK